MTNSSTPTLAPINTPIATNEQRTSPISPISPRPRSFPRGGAICPKCDSGMTVSFMYIYKLCSHCKHQWEVLPPPASISLK
jgi:hypothetical protein